MALDTPCRTIAPAAEGCGSRSVLIDAGPVMALRASRTLDASTAPEMTGEQLISAGRTACLLGALQLASAALDESSGAEPVGLGEPDRFGRVADADGISPGWLLATGYAAWFLGALQVVAAEAGSPGATTAEVTASVSLHPGAARPAEVRVFIDVRLPGLEQDMAEALTRQARLLGSDPYSPPPQVDVQLHLA